MGMKHITLKKSSPDNNAKWFVYKVEADGRVYPWGQALQLVWPSSPLMVPKGHRKGTAEPPGQ